MKTRGKFRLFFSVDIIRSTQLKAAISDWQGLFRLFLDMSNRPMRKHWFAACELGKSEKAEFSKLFDCSDLALRRRSPPDIWKTTGDEIVFVKDLDDELDIWIALVALSNFLLIEGKTFRTAAKKMFLLPHSKFKTGFKGAAWIARFNSDKVEEGESLNVTVPGVSGSNEHVGKSIDAGFRVAKAYSAAYDLALSIEVALFLAEAIVASRSNSFKLGFQEGIELKGVLLGKAAYPKLFINLLVRSEGAVERIVRRPLSAKAIVDVIDQFMREEVLRQRPNENKDNLKDWFTRYFSLIRFPS